MQFENGTAIGVSNAGGNAGSDCSILTKAGGSWAAASTTLKTAAEFGQAIAIARGTPAKPLVEPEDLFEAKIVDATPQAETLGISPGLTGREAVEDHVENRTVTAEHTPRSPPSPVRRLIGPPSRRR
ncbi:MAG: DUF1805 domain-containing protein [Gemmataceae bacterium]